MDDSTVSVPPERPGERLLTEQEAMIERLAAQVKELEALDSKPPMIPAEALPRKSRIAALLDHFATVEDPRDVRRIMHLLPEVLLRIDSEKFAPVTCHMSSEPCTFSTSNCIYIEHSAYFVCGVDLNQKGRQKP